MDDLSTRSPLSEEEVEALIGDLKWVRTVAIDVVVLGNLVRACHELALSRSELIASSIGGATQDGVVGTVFRVGGSEINLSDQAKQALQEHIDYLRNNGYSLDEAAPLFPTTAKTRYNDRKLNKHLKAAQDAVRTGQLERGDSAKANITLEQIKQAGICHHYDHLIQAGKSAEQSLSETAQFARKSERHIRDLLQGRIQPTGRRPDQDPDYCKYMKELDDAFVTGLDAQRREELSNEIRNDPALSDGEKMAFGRWLESIPDSETIRRQQAEAREEERPRHKSLREAIKNYSDDVEKANKPPIRTDDLL